jgi:hypothetical protein
MLRDIRFLLKTRYSNSRALLIGINEYTRAKPLSYAVSDAEELHNALIEDLAFPPENITLLKDRDATRVNILRAYLGFAKNEIDVDERILFFFAGHGHTLTGIRGEIGYLVPSDGDPQDLSTLIRWEELTGNAELMRAKHMLFIMDACYGGLALTRNLAPGSTRFLKDMMLRYSRQVLTAGKADEVEADAGGPLPNHSVFTGHLLEGLRGNARTNDGILTANGLMSYVYGKVAKDKNSHQTPHYGHFDGDGDFIFDAPQLKALEASTETDLDTLIVIPVNEEVATEESWKEKVKRVKSLLASEASSIELHDFIVDEVRRFLARTTEDHFKQQAPYSREELFERIGKYEDLVEDLSLLMACTAHWAKPTHKVILQKAISRSTDLPDIQNGTSTWIYLRWYPIMIELYCSGIAAVAGRRFDSLANIFYAPIAGSIYERRDRVVVEPIAEAIAKLNGQDIFKLLPGHEQQMTPLSEYLFKILQPRLDDVLFIGKGYERAFDEFEVLFALAVADRRKQRGMNAWGPVGRFGWKQRHQDEEAPFRRVITEAREAGDRWEVLQVGLFGGSVERFNATVKEYGDWLAHAAWS